MEYDNFYKDVASIIAEKCIDPKTNRQYTATIIERALKDVHFNPDLKKSAKQQAFTEALPLLQQRFSIQRANMRVRLRIQMQHKTAIKDMIDGLHLVLETTEVDAASGMLQMTCLIEPGMYRTLHKQLEETTHGTGGIELMNLAAFGETQMGPSTQQENEQRYPLPPYVFCNDCTQGRP